MIARYTESLAVVSPASSIGCALTMVFVIVHVRIVNTFTRFSSRGNRIPPTWMPWSTFRQSNCGHEHTSYNTVPADGRQSVIATRRLKSTRGSRFQRAYSILVKEYRFFSPRLPTTALTAVFVLVYLADVTLVYRVTAGLVANWGSRSMMADG